MKVLWVGDAVCGTGFARCTHAACDELQRRGHDVKVLGLNYYGDPHTYPYDIYPCWNPAKEGRDYFGNGRLPLMIDEHEPDVVVFLNDPWNVAAYLMVMTKKSNRVKLGFDVKTVGWLAVDGYNQKYSEQLNWLDSVVTWTDFGKRELIKSGVSAEKLSIVPLGFDNQFFYPSDREVSRRSLPDNLRDSFVLLYVGRNQTRKRLDTLLINYSKWLQRHTEATGKPPHSCLILCTNTTGEKDFDLESLVNYLNIKDSVMIVQPPNNAIKDAVSNDNMRFLYSAADVFVTCSQAEGWCLPVLEAMACGTACVLPDSGGFDWASEAAVMVPCSSMICTSPVNASMFTLGSLVNTDLWIEAVDSVYRADIEARKLLMENSLGFSKGFTWEASGNNFADKLEALMSNA